MGNRGPYLDSLLSAFLQAQLRKTELYLFELDTERPVLTNALDYYLNLTQYNENAYSALRLSSSEILAGSKPLITGLETQDMCAFIVTEQYVKEANAAAVNQTSRGGIGSLESYTDECKMYANKILQLGMQQSINAIMQNVL